ncbi:MAG: molybdopterin-synthase adenylyltransferase MoeB [Gemmatimonadota bacterium]
MAKVTIRIPTPLRSFVGGRAAIEVEAETADEALERLTNEHDALRAQLYGDDGVLRRFVNVYVGERDLRSLEPEQRRLRGDEELRIVPSIAGGASTEATPLAGSKAHEELGTRELQRYSRHLMIPEVGVEGQMRLKQARVLLVGAGGLGSPLALYLAAAGVGRLGIVDHDVVDFTNLQRQVLHDTLAVGRPKLESARERIHALNPGVQVVPYEARLDSSNALDILSGWEVVADGSDNFPTRYLVNDACVLLGIPTVWGAIYRFEGQASVFGVDGGPCYRCIFREPPPPGLVPSCADAGVLGVLPGIVGTIQATETVKLILGVGRTLAGRLLLIDALRMEFRELEVRRDPECPVCGDEPTITEPIDYEAFCATASATSPASAPASGTLPEIDVHELKRRLDAGEPLHILDVREPYEWEICNLAFAGARLIPLDELPERTDELPTDLPLVVLCRSGVRSARAVRHLHDVGLGRAVNLEGGMLAWARAIDPSMPTY